MIDSILRGLGISLFLVFSVGPVIFTIVKQSINNGRAGGFSFVAGVWLSDFSWAILSNVFSELVAELLNFKKEIGFVGGLFLMGMGIYYLFFKKIIINEEGIKIKASTHAKLFTSGFLINTLNPGVIVFWLTWASFFSLYPVVQRIIIFSTCLGVNIGADILKVVLAGKLRDKLTVKNISWLNKISGLLLLIFGIVLMVDVFYRVVK